METKAARVPVERRMYEISEFCTAFRISRSSLYTMFARGEGPAFMKRGRRTLISVDAADKWARETEERSRGHFGSALGADAA